MAGPWLKMECASPEKPEVLAITAAMGWDDPDLTIGKLFRLWRWFDQHTVDGNAASVTPALLDRVIGVSGFVQAVANEGWLTFDGHGITLTNFERHNGETAKQRALTAKRVAAHKSNAEGNAEGNGNSVTSALPRGRGRDNSSSLRSEESAPKVRASRKCPNSWQLTPELMDWAGLNAPAVNVRLETEKFRDYTFKTAHTDWDGAWRNWLRRAAESQPRASPTRTGETPYQRSMRERMEQIVPGIAAPRPNQQGEIFNGFAEPVDRQNISEIDADLRPRIPWPLGGPGP